ncbi:MAG: formylglycine-generating enzyme family protein [Planctomycetota bacterium]
MHRPRPSLLLLLCLGLSLTPCAAADKYALLIGVTTYQKPQNSNRPPRLTNSIGQDLVLIPAGNFLMGSPEGEQGRYDDEGPQHRVEISKPFYMGRTEVTQGQWKAVMGKEPWKGQSFVQEGDQNAASYISWDDATEFCRRLSQKEGKTYRLPTEAEWE